MYKTTFIGHRNIFDNNLINKLYKCILEQIKKGCYYFIVGTNGEFDKLALSSCLKLQKIFPNIQIEIIATTITKASQYANFFGINQNKKNLLITMYEIEEIYFKNQIIVSNKKMIDNCNTLICYVDKTKHYGGAILGYKYAKNNNKEIINLF